MLIIVPNLGFSFKNRSHPLISPLKEKTEFPEFFILSHPLPLKMGAEEEEEEEEGGLATSGEDLPRNLNPLPPPFPGKQIGKIESEDRPTPTETKSHTSLNPAATDPSIAADL